MTIPLTTDRHLDLAELIQFYAEQRSSDIGQETVDRLEELQRKRIEVEELREEINDLRRRRYSLATTLDVGFLMEKAQEFASTWALVGTRFDAGTMLEEAEKRRLELYRALTHEVKP